MDFSIFSNDELADLVKGNYSREIVGKNSGDLMLENFSIDDLLADSSLQDEAAKAHYLRQLEKSDHMTQSMLDEILDFPIHASARQLVGECAIWNQLPRNALDTTLIALDSSEWSFRQVRGRMLVWKFEQVEDRDVRSKIIHEILELGTGIAWAIKEIVPEMGGDELQELLNNVSVKSQVLNRGDRHQIRELIKAILEKEKKA